MKKVIFDIDGVLADFEGQAVKELYRKFQDIGKANRHLFRFEDRFNGYSQVIEYANGLVADANFYYALPPIEEGIAFLEELMNEGYEIIYVTSRPLSAYSFTYRWLLKNTTDIEPNVICGVGDKANFVSHLKNEVEFVVDDNPEQIARIKEVGLVVVCWSQPWNEGIFPRLYVRSDGEVMLWAKEDIEAEPFFTTEQE